MSTKAEQVFRAKAPILIEALVTRRKWPLISAFCAAGNGGGESNGFTQLQEIKPTVKGSRGGRGWFQWTGPRRRAFEAWCKANMLDPDSDEANINYLLYDLGHDEAATNLAMKTFSGTLEEGVKLFEQKFERAGIKNYANRLAWANIALDEWRKLHPEDATLPHPKPVAPPAEISIPGLDKPMTASSTNAAAIGGVATTTISAFSGLDWKVACLFILAATAIAGVIIWQRWKYAKAAREAGV